jgi:coenzyme Q-binding protein COQ10
LATERHDFVAVIERAERMLPYGCDQVFDLAADIERYPEFLQGWISARVLRRESDILYVEQVLGFGPVRLQFVSKAELRRPEHIQVSSEDARFRRFSFRWEISEAPTSGCRIGFAAEFEFRSGWTQHLVNPFLSGAIQEVGSAFEARAHALFSSSQR